MFSRGKLIYIAGPYAHPDPVQNTNRACKVADELILDGFIPYIPHLALLWHLITPHNEQFWYDYNYHMLKRCDAVLRIDGDSVGADKEIELAKEYGIPVFYSGEDLRLWPCK
jgi:nucleoside 2-deoxyribosyltransferase